jgi:hypothetical protein
MARLKAKPSVRWRTARCYTCCRRCSCRTRLAATVSKTRPCRGPRARPHPHLLQTPVKKKGAAKPSALKSPSRGAARRPAFARTADAEPRGCPMNPGGQGVRTRQWPPAGLRGQAAHSACQAHAPAPTRRARALRQRPAPAGTPP